DCDVVLAERFRLLILELLLERLLTAEGNLVLVPNGLDHLADFLLQLFGFGGETRGDGPPFGVVLSEGHRQLCVTVLQLSDVGAQALYRRVRPNRGECIELRRILAQLNQRLVQLLFLEPLVARARYLGADVPEFAGDDVVLRVGQRHRAVLFLVGLKGALGVVQLRALFLQLVRQKLVRVLRGQRAETQALRDVRLGQCVGRPRRKRRIWRLVPDIDEPAVANRGHDQSANESIDAGGLPAGLIGGRRLDGPRRAEQIGERPQDAALVALCRGLRQCLALLRRRRIGHSHGLQRAPGQRPALQHAHLRLVEVVVVPAFALLEHRAERTGALRILLDQELRRRFVDGRLPQARRRRIGEDQREGPGGHPPALVEHAQVIGEVLVLAHRHMIRRPTLMMSPGFTTSVFFTSLRVMVLPFSLRVISMRLSEPRNGSMPPASASTCSTFMPDSTLYAPTLRTYPVTVTACALRTKTLSPSCSTMLCVSCPLSSSRAFTVKVCSAGSFCPAVAGTIRRTRTSSAASGSRPPALTMAARSVSSPA